MNGNITESHRLKQDWAHARSLLQSLKLGYLRLNVYSMHANDGKNRRIGRMLAPSLELGLRKAKELYGDLHPNITVVERPQKKEED